MPVRSTKSVAKTRVETGTQNGGQEPARIKDIAQALGISIGTVDRALHSRGRINQLTKDRVLKMAEALGYKPNLAARYLKSPRQLRLSIHLPAEIASFFDAVREGIESAATQFEPAIELCFRSHPRLGEGDVELFQQALEDGSKGIIIAPGNPAQMKSWVHKAARKGVPVVCVSTDAPMTERLTAVSADPFTNGAIVGELLSRMLPESGPVVVVTGDLSTFDHAEKLRGFKNSLQFSKAPLSIASVLQTHDDEKSAYTQTIAVLKENPKLAAIYVSTANSKGVLRAVKEIDPKGRVALITTDLFAEVTSLLNSGRIIATIDQRPATQGRLALEAIYQYLAEGKCPPSRIKLAPHIVMRSNLELFLDRMPSARKTRARDQIL